MRFMIRKRFFSTSSVGFNKTLFRAPSPNKPRLVLAYSGGLDTSCQLNYLVEEKGFEVCAYIANLGQSDVDSETKITEIREKAKKSGAYAFYCEDVEKPFIEDFVYPLMTASALYEGRYLLGTSIARPCIAQRQIDVLKNEKATFVSHGSTGKGNDQVRFELAYHCLHPGVQTVTLWREKEYCAKFQGRQDLQKYALAKGIIKSEVKKPWAYSEDENAMHISYESGELEDTSFPATSFDGKSDMVEYPGQIFKKKLVPVPKTPNISAVLKVEFKSGVPSKVVNLRDKKEVSGSVEIFRYLNKLGGEHGVGGVDLVENRFVGMKSRGCYETPGGTILFSAHRDLELLTLDREVMRIKDNLSQEYARLVYNGYWFSPEMSFLKQIMKSSQQLVTGSAYIELYKGNVRNIGRESELSLYDKKLVSMDEHGGYDPTNATGFINTLLTRLRANRKRDDKAGVGKW